MSTINVKLSQDSVPSLLQQAVSSYVNQDSDRNQEIVKSNLITVIACTPEVSGQTQIQMSRATKDESRLSGLPPYLINAFDLVLNVKSHDRKKELKESCLSTLHLFAGHLVNNRIQEEINEKNGIPNEKSNTMSPEQLIKYIDSMAGHTLPICPEPIVNLLRNYDQMLNVSYS